MKYLLTIMTAIMLMACTPDAGTATRAVRDMGFTDVSLGSHDYLGWGCPEDMRMNVSFTATQPNNGRRVQGIICCDYWGACTVRTR